MKERITLLLVILLVIIPAVRIEAEHDNEGFCKQIIINFPCCKSEFIDLTVNNPLKKEEKFIKLQVKNPEKKKLEIELRRRGFKNQLLNENIDYVIQDQKDKGKGLRRGHIKSRIREKTSFKTRARVYNGWIKIDFKGLEDDWWRVKAGTHADKIIITVSED